ncbi:hypothetical protein [Lacipirellula parvula]|uniref:AsmA-like C-terminal domain-containing protein n=1 Tax=Lacipirellula parvula TaxID=2650471 RepID=A0A5K7XPK3_9BACT|nr:hypothetical protein [Lacipirellula parvula]BBO35329.1 hypothetical protein PLANPX_4941 [Lacipirellula parvula]
MFAFHETTRKRICRTGFFALCLAPTCATAAWIVDHHLPWRQAAAARRLSDRYHLQVQLSDYREPRPNFLRTASATVADPQVAAPLLKLTGVETHRGDTLALSIDELALSVADLPALAERLEWWFQRTAARRIDLLVKRVTLTAPVITQLHQLRATIERDAAGKLGFRLIAHTTATPAADAKPLKLWLETPAATEDGAPEHAVVTLDTEQNALPASLLAPLVPGAAALNDTATFTGSVEWKSSHPLGGPTTPAWEGDLKGQFTGVDLARLIPQTSSHKLQGTATLELADCRWRDARFTHLAGTLVAAPNARLNGAFLFAARKYLVCRISSSQPTLQAAAERYAYPYLHQAEELKQHAAADAALAEDFHLLDRLACQFKLDATGLIIAPPSEEAATADATEAIAVANGHPLLLAAADAKAAAESGSFTPVRLPAASWLQFMANSTSLWLPFTPEAVETARRLPRPE